MIIRTTKSQALTGIALAMTAWLAGCVQYPAVKDIAKDKPAYLAANFSPEALPAAVRKKLPAEGAHPLPFKVLTLKGVVAGSIGLNRVAAQFTTTLVNAKDTGLVEQLYEVSSNGIPSAASFSLSYLNLFFMKQETTSYAATVAPPPTVVHEVENDLLHMGKPQEDMTFTATASTGVGIQIVNFRVAVSTCHTGHYYPAARIRKGLAGEAIDIDCRETLDGILRGTNRRTYLSDYGVYVLRETATTTSKLGWSYRTFDRDGVIEPAVPETPDKSTKPSAHNEST